MKQTLQSIKVNVVDQEVAVMNTLTSDQLTESDYQLDLVMQQSSGPQSASNHNATETRRCSTGFKLADLKNPVKMEQQSKLYHHLE